MAGHSPVGGDWRFLRRRSVPALVRRLAVRHPELERPCVWDDFVRICEREQVVVRVVDMPPKQRGRLLRVGSRVFLRLNRCLSRDERTVVGFHELAHYWRDDPGVPCYYADEGDSDSGEEFADIFAWAVTSPARVFVRGLRDEDF